MFKRMLKPMIRYLLLLTLQISSLSHAQAPEAPQAAEAAAATAAVPAEQAAPAPAAPVAAAPVAEAAPPAPKLDSGNTAWMLTSTALVLLMTLPGVALFYGGMVRKKNVLSICSQVFAIAVIVTLTWTVIGYSIAMQPGNGFMGDLTGRLFMYGLTPESMAGVAGENIPESVFAMFQLTFAIITAALIPGAVAERMKFSAVCWFVALWSILVYAPVAHWVWEPTGWLFKMGVLDFAGGTVVHVNAGVAGLICAIALGQRKGFGKEPMVPHNLALTITGGGLLWVGWFGFNAGSAVAANGSAGMAMLVTQIATAAAALGWMLMEWLRRGRISALGIVSGAVGGLVAITPASGFVDPRAALVIGFIAGIACYAGATTLKSNFGYDDSLDVFGIHGIGGAMGAIMTGIFSTVPNVSIQDQVVNQLIGISVTALYSGFMTLIILVVLNSFLGLRAKESVERDGLDRNEHGEHID